MNYGYIPKVVQVIPKRDYHVIVYFDDGKIVEKDMSEPLANGIVFEPLNDPDTFVKTCCVLNDTLAWDLEGKRDPYNAIDLDPIALYELPSANAIYANEDRLAV